MDSGYKQKHDLLTAKLLVVDDLLILVFILYHNWSMWVGAPFVVVYVICAVRVILIGRRWNEGVVHR